MKTSIDHFFLFAFSCQNGLPGNIYYNRSPHSFKRSIFSVERGSRRNIQIKASMNPSQNEGVTQFVIKRGNVCIILVYSENSQHFKLVFIRTIEGDVKKGECHFFLMAVGFDSMIVSPFY